MATSNAILWVNHPSLMLTRVGGLSILERQLFTLARAGILQVWIGTKQPAAEILAALRLPPNLKISWVARQGETAKECPVPYLGISGDHFLRVETLKFIAQASYETHTIFHDTLDASVVEIIPSRLEQYVGPGRHLLPAGTSVFLQHPITESSSPIVDWLLSIGPKSQDGFMARNFDRYISLAISRLLLNTRIAPNMMTCLSCFLGLAGTVFFLNPVGPYHFAGASLVWLHSVLDGCDGELARIRFQESVLGGDLDFFGDNLVHLSLFGCLAAGFYRADSSLVPLVLGAAAAVGILGSALLTYLQKLALRRGAKETPETETGGKNPIISTLARLENILAQRDFIYLLLFLASIHRTYEFLWAGAVGSLLFFVMMLYLGRTNHEQVSRTYQEHYSR